MSISTDSPKYTELALLIQPIGQTETFSSAPSATWKLHFVSVDPGKLAPRNIGDYFDYAEPLRGFQDLEIRTHLFGDNPNGYNWQLKYSEIYSADLRDLERRYKCLSALERKIEKIAKQYGSPQTFGEYVAQVMLAAGIKQSFESCTNNGHSYDDNDFRRRDVADTRYRLASMRHVWFEANGKKDEEAA